MLTGFHYSFTAGLSSKRVMKQSLKIVQEGLLIYGYRIGAHIANS